MAKKNKQTYKKKKKDQEHVLKIITHTPCS